MKRGLRGLVLVSALMLPLGCKTVDDKRDNLEGYEEAGFSPDGRGIVVGSEEAFLSPDGRGIVDAPEVGQALVDSEDLASHVSEGCERVVKNIVGSQAFEANNFADWNGAIIGGDVHSRVINIVDSIADAEEEQQKKP